MLREASKSEKWGDFIIFKGIGFVYQFSYCAHFSGLRFTPKVLKLSASCPDGADSLRLQLNRYIIVLIQTSRGSPWRRMVLALVHKQAKGEKDAVDEPRVEDVVTEVETNREATKEDEVGIKEEVNRLCNPRSNPAQKHVNRTINRMIH